MSRFVDVYLPASLPGYPCYASPRTNTTITAAAGGDENANQNWVHPLRTFKLPKAIRSFDVLQDVTDQFLVMPGPKRIFPFRDPLDFASIRLRVPNELDVSILARISATDQAFGTGDGTTRVFPLVKTYSRGGQTYVRAINLPVRSSLLIADAGTPTSAYSVTREGGVVTFDVAPANGHALTWGGLFDCPVRFAADNALDGIVENYQVAGVANLELTETRLC